MSQSRSRFLRAAGGAVLLLGILGLALMLPAAVGTAGAGTNYVHDTALFLHTHYPLLKTHAATNRHLELSSERLGNLSFTGYRLASDAGSKAHSSFAPGVALLFPTTYDQPFVARAGAVAVTLLAERAAPVSIASEGDRVLYREVYQATDVFYDAGRREAEEFIILHDAKSPAQFTYKILSRQGVRSVEIHDGAITFVPAFGGESLVLLRPVVVDARGKRSEQAARWKLSGDNLVLALDPRGLTYPLVIDPGFGTAATPTAARAAHTATLLNDDNILVVGGLGSNGQPQATAELFNPDLDTFTLTGSMATARQLHSAVLLSSGATATRVLVLGGLNGSGSSLASTEIYSPATGVFSAGPSMSTSRASFTATLLRDGRVLVAGGLSGGTPTNTAEIYDPGSNSFSAAANTMAQARSAHTATLLPDGRVLIAGGLSTAGLGLTDVEAFDPTTNSFSTLAPLLAGRLSHTATLLDSGKVLIAGGAAAPNGVVLSSTEVYDPSAGGSSTPGPMLNTARLLHTANLLPNGQVVIAGGTGLQNVVLNSTEIYTPTGGVNGTISPGPNMQQARTGHTAAEMHNGEVLMVDGAGMNIVNRSAEFFENDTGTFAATAAGSLAARRAFTTTPLADGTVLLAGGLDATGTAVATAEIYNPSTGTSVATAGGMNAARSGHTATLLANGNVLITGGSNSGGLLASAEFYFPATATFIPTGSMNDARTNHAAALLPDGEVLVTGGQDPSSSATCTAEVWNPNTGSFIITGAMNNARVFHTATTLPNGLVLVAGGFGSIGDSLDTAELYSLALGTFSLITVASSPHVMKGARAQHTATLLDSGIVLLAGGRFRGAFNGMPVDVVINTSEVFVPFVPAGTQPFFPVGSMAFDRARHTATLMSNGQVLMAGGVGCAVTGLPACVFPSLSSTLNTAEVFTAASLSFFSPTVPMLSARAQGGAALLDNDKVLLADGAGTTGTAQSAKELFDYTGALSTAPAPSITSFPATLVPGASVTIGGSGLQPGEASGGNDSQNSAANVPVVFLRRIDSGIAESLTVTSFSNTAIGVTLPATLESGEYEVVAMVAGRPSNIVFSDVAASPTPPPTVGALQSCPTPTATPTPVGPPPLPTRAEAIGVQLSLGTQPLSFSTGELGEAEAPSSANVPNPDQASFQLLSLVLPSPLVGSVTLIDSHASVSFLPPTADASTRESRLHLDLTSMGGPLIDAQGIVAQCSSTTSASNGNGSRIGSLLINSTPVVNQAPGTQVIPIGGPASTAPAYVIINCQSPNNQINTSTCSGPFKNVNSSSIDVRELWVLLLRSHGAAADLSLVLGEAECSAGSTTPTP